jgi:hypothetical protein
MMRSGLNFMCNSVSFISDQLLQTFLLGKTVVLVKKTIIIQMYVTELLVYTGKSQLSIDWPPNSLSVKFIASRIIGGRITKRNSLQFVESSERLLTDLIELIIKFECRRGL